VWVCDYVCGCVCMFGRPCMCLCVIVCVCFLCVGVYVCACVCVFVRASVLGICIWNTPNVEHIEIKATRRFFEF
jgi:hypothetical protein